MQLAKILGASRVYAVDINSHKLELAISYGAVGVLVDPNTNTAVIVGEPDYKNIPTDVVNLIKDHSEQDGVDISLELIGLPQTIVQGLHVLKPMGRLAVVGITNKHVEIYPYRDVLGKEREIIGVSDHLITEIHELISFVQNSLLDMSSIITRTISLNCEEVNLQLSNLAAFSGCDVRVVILPNN